MEPQTIFVVMTSIILIFIAYFIPKKMKTYEIYVTSLFATLFGLLVDSILALKYKLYVLDKPGIQLPPLFGQVIFYFSASIIVLNLYPYHRPIKWKIGYLLAATILTLVLEYAAFKFRFISYNEWNIGYSALSYPFLIYFLVLHYKFFKWLVKKSA